MKKSATKSAEFAKAKRDLGKKIKRLPESHKEKISLKALAATVGLSPSNMKYVEDGVNAPTADVYQAIIHKLSPNKKCMMKWIIFIQSFVEHLHQTFVILS